MNRVSNLVFHATGIVPVPAIDSLYIRRINICFMKASHWAITATALLATACTKEPGVGGKAEIRGRVFITEYDNNTNQPNGNTYFAPDYRVYITYGDNDFYDDNVDTDPNGLFVYSWMRKGKYTVFTYSDCPDSCESGVEVKSKTVEINDSKEVVDVGTFEVKKY